MPGLAQVAQTVAPLAVDAATQAVMGMFTAGGGGYGNPSYSTQQADDAMRNNTQYTQGMTNEQLRRDFELERQKAAYANQMAQNNLLFTGNVANAASNANTARNMAANAQAALNSVYMNAGDRVNRAAADTMNAITAAGQTAAGMFR